MLIGLYFAPGVVLSLPGGALGQTFGDKATVLGALLLMLVGSLVMASAASWSIQIAGRLVAGAGGVILSVQMTKMLTDWFEGERSRNRDGDLCQFMAGVAVSLLVLPLIGTTRASARFILAWRRRSGAASSCSRSPIGHRWIPWPRQRRHRCASIATPLLP